MPCKHWGGRHARELESDKRRVQQHNCEVSSGDRDVPQNLKSDFISTNSIIVMKYAEKIIITCYSSNLIKLKEKKTFINYELFCDFVILTVTDSSVGGKKRAFKRINQIIEIYNVRRFSLVIQASYSFNKQNIQKFLIFYNFIQSL